MPLEKNWLLPRRSLGAALLGVAAAACTQSAGDVGETPEGALTLPARVVPPPASISAAAQAALRTGAQRPRLQTPAAGDILGWRANIAMVNAMMDPYVDQMARNPAVQVDAYDDVGGVEVHRVVSPGAPLEERQRAHLYIHGGAWVYGSGRRVLIPAVVTALHYGGVVHAPDFRLPPDHPFPAAIDDCFAIYRALLARHPSTSILVSGESSGGNIAAGLMHKIKDEGLPKPCALFLNTPVTDISGAGDSLVANRGLDVVLQDGAGDAPALYLGGAERNHPYASPIEGDLAAAFPPTYLRSGTRDLLLSDTVRLHARLRKASVEADLYIGEAMPHAGFAVLAGADTPEDVDAREDTRRWLERRWPSPHREARSPG